jgi:hypothetical protein
MEPVSADYWLTLYIGGRHDEFTRWCRDEGLRCTGPVVDAVHICGVADEHAFAGLHAPRLRIVYAEEPTAAVREALAPVLAVMREGSVEEIHLHA